MLFILDRDGVINQDSKDYIKSPEEWVPIPGSLHAIARLNQLGYQVVVATNQSGVGRGYYSLDTLRKIHQKMCDQLAEMGGRIDNIYFCPHKPDDGCHCRKPEPGMFEDILRDYGIQPSEAILIGDSLRDIQAAHAVSCRAVLVLTGNGLTVVSEGNIPDNVPVYENLSAVADAVLKNGMP